MLLSVEELRTIYTNLDFSKYSEDLIKRKLAAIESALRPYTRNNFQVRTIRAVASCEFSTLMGNFKYFKEGDTIEVTNSLVNDGLYVIEYKESDASVTIDTDLFECAKMLVTKVSYPIDIVDGCVNLLNWELNYKSMEGVASESISRHSVSYKSYDANNTIEGYPAEMWGFAKKYCNWMT